MKRLWLILPFLFILSCEDWSRGPGVKEEFDEISVYLNPRLPKDDNGYYHLPIDMGRWQTLHRIEGLAFTADTTAYVPNLRVEWESNLYWIIGDTLGYVVKRGLTDDLVYVSYDTVYITQYNGFTVPTTNQVSYSNGYGEINNMIAPVQTMKGDTMYLTATFFQWSITDWETIEIPIVLD
jgi:hypothetical protein